MTLSKYRAFLTAVETGSFTAAAKKLFCTQSAVSRMVNDLEEQWGVTLLNRRKSGVTLTSSGWALVPYIRSVCAEEVRLEGVLDEMTGLKIGTIRIGLIHASAQVWMPKVLPAFHQLFPAIRFELSIGNTEAIENWLNEDRVDVGVMVAPFDPSFNAQLLLMDEIKVVFPKGHELSHYDKVPVEMLGHYPLVLNEQGWCREVKDFFSDSRNNVVVKFKTVSSYAIESLIASGLGISLLPQLSRTINPFGLENRSLEPAAWRRIYLVTKDIPTSPAIKAFITYMPKILFSNPPV